MNTTRRNLMRAAGGGALLALAPFQKALAAPEFRYKYANNLPPSHPMNLRANEAAQNIARDTGGRFELAVFPAASWAPTRTPSASCARAPSSSSPCPD